MEDISLDYKLEIGRNGYFMREVNSFSKILIMKWKGK